MKTPVKDNNIYEYRYERQREVMSRHGVKDNKIIIIPDYEEIEGARFITFWEWIRLKRSNYDME